MSVFCIHNVTNDGRCDTCGKALRLAEYRLLLQPVYVDDDWPEERRRRYGPPTMPTMHVTPENLQELIDDPDAAAEVLRRLREAKEGKKPSDRDD